MTKNLDWWADVDSLALLIWLPLVPAFLAVFVPTAGLALALVGVVKALQWADRMLGKAWRR